MIPHPRRGLPTPARIAGDTLKGIAMNGSDWIQSVIEQLERSGFGARADGLHDHAENAITNLRAAQAERRALVALLPWVHKAIEKGAFVDCAAPNAAARLLERADALLALDAAGKARAA